jgi:hypothetical protein
VLVTLYPAGGLRSIRLPQNVFPEYEYYKILEMRILDEVLLICPRKRRPREKWALVFRSSRKAFHKRLFINSEIAISSRKVEW